MLVTSTSTSAQAWGALPAEGEYLPGWCASRNLDIVFIFDGGNLQFGSQTCLSVADGHLAQDIVAIASEEFAAPLQSLQTGHLLGPLHRLHHPSTQSEL